jgi:hypothetical protein
MQAFKKQLSSQDILTLKEKVSWKNRLKLIVEKLKEEENELMIDGLKQIEASNISELNNILTKMKRPFMEVSDLVKDSNLTLLQANFTLTPKFALKAINEGLAQKYYRISIMSKFPIQVDSTATEFFSLPTK